MKVYAGIDVGGTKVALGLFGEDKTLLGKAKLPSDPGLSGEEFFRQVVDALESLLEKQGLAALYGSSSGVPFLARPRRQEIFACFNRFRGLRL